MKLKSLLLLTLIGTTLTPILSQSFLPTAMAAKIDSLALAQQTTETIDFGTRVVNARPSSLPLTFTVPPSQFMYKVAIGVATPNSPPSPFKIDSTGAYLGAGSSRDIKLNVTHSGGAVGTHSQIVEIRGNSQLIKVVLLKVKIVPHPNSSGVDGSSNQTQQNINQF